MINYMIRCWLFASVTPEIADQLMLSESAKMFWDSLLERKEGTQWSAAE